MEVTTKNLVAAARMVHKTNVGRPNESERTYDRLYQQRQGFKKPDKPVINEMVDGYRKPSSYSCPALTQNAAFRGTGERYVQHLSATQERIWEGRVMGVFRPPVSPLNVNNVRMKVLNNVRGEILDVAMVLAEVSGTANTLSNNLLRLARSMDQVRLKRPDSFYYLLNGKRRDGRRPTDKFQRETAGAYLEWKYGIMPTVYDIQGACKGLDMSADGSLFDNPPLLVARARDVSIRRENGKGSVILPGGGTGRPLVEPIPYRVHDEIKARLDYRVSGEGLRGLNRYGIGLGSVATVAFDKTPFSFVLNMAVPIAELIKAWTALAGVDVVGYCETTYRQVDVLGHSNGIDLKNLTPPDSRWLLNMEENEKAVWEFSRRAFSSPPMPVPYVRNPVKVGNISTVLALFTQMRSPTAYK